MESSAEQPLIYIYKKLYAFFGPQKWWPARTRFEVIIGAILTQNTAWANVEKAIRNLRRSGILSGPAAFKGVSKKRLAALITPAGYYNIKAGRLENFVEFLFSKYGGSLSRLSGQDIDKLRYELLSVNGIGPETCDSILLYAFKKAVFVVDAYTRRIFSRHKFFEEDAAYDEIQNFFMKNLSKDARLYNEYHALIVRLGKEFCRKNADCKRCPLNPSTRLTRH